MKTSYKQKFIILFLLFGFLVVSISFIGIYFVQSKNIKEEFFKSSKTVTASKQELFESFFNRLQNTTTALSNAIATDGNLERFNNYTNLLLVENPDILKLSLFNIQFETLKEVKRVPLQDPKNFDLKTLWLSDIKKIGEEAYIFFQNPIKTEEKNYVLSIAFSVSSLFEGLEHSPIGYIHLVDETGKFIVYKDSFLKEKNLLLDRVYPDISEDILFADYYIGLDMYAKKLSIGEKEYKIIFQMREDIIENKKGELITLSLYTLLGVILLSLPIAYMFSIIPDRLNRQLQDLNESLEKRVEEEVALRREKEQMVIHQSKMAAMGEMIGAIGHQWRQPLNTIGLIAITIKALFKREKLTEETLTHELLQVENQLEFMSKTIDDFKNFFKKDKEKSSFDALKGVQDVLTLISPQILQNTIRVNFVYKENSTPIKELGFEEEEYKKSKACVHGYFNEFKQVILNILNNAKDILLEKEIENPLINIVVDKQDSTVIVSIEDNGGGIPEDIKEKIFTPYFSTKGDKGTGIGLDLAKKIIEESMEGELLAENSAIGAQFLIKLPAVDNDFSFSPSKTTQELQQEKTDLKKEQDEISSKEYVQQFFEDLSHNKDNIKEYNDDVYNYDEKSNFRF